MCNKLCSFFSIPAVFNLHDTAVSRRRMLCEPVVIAATCFSDCLFACPSNTSCDAVNRNLVPRYPTPLIGVDEPVREIRKRQRGKREEIVVPSPEKREKNNRKIVE